MSELNRRSKDSYTQLIGANQVQREINQQLEAMVKNGLKNWKVRWPSSPMPMRA